MLSSWFGSVSSRRSQRRQTRSNPPPAPDDAPSGPSDASSVSRSTVGPLRTPTNLTSTFDVPLDEVHAPTSSLVHSAEKNAGTSDAATSLDASLPQRDSGQFTEGIAAATPERLEGALFTPQDAIVAQVFRKSIPFATDSARAAPLPSSNALQPSVSLMTSDSLTPPSMQTTPSSRARPGPTLTIYDPFSGVKLGEHTPISSSTATPGELFSAAPLPTTDDRKLWSSLERILELQAEIAAMHADMEGVGGRGSGSAHVGGITGVGAGEGGNAGPSKRSRRGQTLPIGDEEHEEHESEGGATRAVSEVFTDHSDGEDDEDEDEDEDDIHGYGKRRRDEEFSRLAEQFAQRKAAIGGIMNRLDDLSTALKTFHALPPPLFDRPMSPSRTDTVSSESSNASTPVSPPPHQVHPGRLSSPLSSTSPSQAASSVAPPAVTHPPPVPPISTLAPPVTSNDPGAPLGLGAIVAPVLPRTALPRIIPGGTHVESPIDMNPTQSVFRGVP